MPFYFPATIGSVTRANRGAMSNLRILALTAAGEEELIRWQDIHLPDRLTERVFGGDSEILGVPKQGVDRKTPRGDQYPQNIFVDGACFYSRTASVEINPAQETP